MVAPLFDREKLDRSGFFSTQLAEVFKKDPVGLIDVGARWGIDEVFRAAAPVFDAMAFEPDAEEAARVAAREAGGDWAKCSIIPAALGAKTGSAVLNILERANNSSIYLVDPDVARRYRLFGFELQRTEDVQLETMDSFVFDQARTHPFAGEVIKLDVQGAESDILAGGGRTLSEQTQCLICEVAFFAPYSGISLFPEIEQALRVHGLSFYGFLDFQHRGTRRLDKTAHRGRERFMQADAVFFRDLAVNPACDDSRGLDVLFLMAILLGYFDYALEVSEIIGGDKGAELTAVVLALSRIDTAQERRDLQTLQDASADPAALQLALSRLVDSRRDFATVHDVTGTPGGDADD